MKSTKFIIFLLLCLSLTGCSKINSLFLSEHISEAKEVDFYIDKNEWEEIANNAENKNIADFVYYTINPEIEKNIKVFADQNKNQVFCFSFFAAGNKTLFKINLYPSELGYRFKSVGGSPTKC